MTGFKLTVERITEKAESHSFEVSGEWWAQRDQRTLEHDDELCIVERPFDFEIEVSRVREEVLLDGKFRGQVALECSRCAKRYSQPLLDSFQLALAPASARPAGGLEEGSGSMDPEDERGLAENGMCLGEDLDAGWFRGPVIRLDELFGEVIALAMPLQPLCQEDCPGICPHCGIDLARSTCDCVDEKIESPFAVLAQLKGDDD